MKKKIITLSLVAVLSLSILGLTLWLVLRDKGDDGGGGSGDPDTSTYTIDGDYIYFGKYPQTLKSSGVSVSAKPNSEGYYLGSDGELYAKVTSSKYCYSMDPDNFGNYIDFEFSNGSKISSSFTYYFKVEPIKWRIVKSDSNKALLISDVVLDVQQFNSTQSQKTIDGKTVYSSNYEHSDLRKWLNESFFNTAFTSTQQGLINTYAVDNSASTSYSDSCPYYSNTTFDKVFLFSYQDFISQSYGFDYHTSEKDEARVRVSTDYSRALGCMSIEDDTFGNGTYWLRSPYANEGDIFVSAMYSDGRMNTYGYDYRQIVEGISGVVPALLLQLNGTASDSDQECSHNWGDWVVSEEATCTVGGIKTRICSLCFKNDKDTSALGHTYNEDEAVIVEPTCTNTGKIDGTCTRCEVVASSVIDALGHSFTNYAVTDATCTDDSYKTAKCDRCDETDKVINEGTASGHDYGNDGRCTKCSAINSDLKVTSLEISNDSFLLEAGTAEQVKFTVYPAEAIYEKVTYRIYQNNTCEATLTDDGLLTCAKVGSVTVAVTIDDEITARATFYVPQLITTAEQFYNIRNDLSGIYMLANDIDLSEYEYWTPIGNATKSSSGNYDYTNAFSGKFDGGGYTISGLNLDLSQTSCSSLLTVGLFGSLSRDGQISNVVLENAVVTGSNSATDYLGVLVGFNPGSVGNCEISGAVTVSGATYIGGVIGENIGSAEKVSSDIVITVTGSNHYFVGGITGRTNGGQLSNASVLGTINVTSGVTVYVGGIAGNLVDKLTNASADVDITVKTSNIDYTINYVGIIAGASSQALSAITANGSVKVDSPSCTYLGGIVGYSNAAISDCVNNATVELSVSNSDSYIGGIVGCTSESIKNCENNSKVSANQLSGGYVGGIAGKAANISDCKNSAPIYARSTSNKVYCGGISGYSKSVKASENNAEITALVYASHYNYVGGLNGYSEEAVSNCINGENGKLVINYSYSTSSASSSQYFGGIVGYGKTTVTECSNYADISAYSDGVIFCGGVAGYVGSDITNINNYGYSITVTSASTYSGYNNFVGGVAGYVNGKLETAYNTALLDITKGSLAAGGIAGYVNGTSSSAKNTAKITVNNSISAQNTTYVGGIIGNTPSSITNSSATGSNIFVTVKNNVYAGGIAGKSDGTITECYAYPDITVSNSYDTYVGGVSGYAAKIVKSYSASEIVSSTHGAYNLYAGGLSGYITAGAEESYATGDISGTSSSKVYMAGLIGYVGSRATVKDCYASNGYIKTDSSSFSPSSEIQIYNGGLVGFNDGTISSCYAVNYNYSISHGSSNSHIHYIGGLAAYNNGSITGSYVLDATDKLARTGLEISRDVVGSGTAERFYAGGFVGYNQGSVSNCYSDATVNTTVSGAYTGGFVGFNNSTVKYALAYGEVNSGITGDTTGGFAGGGASGYTSCFFSKDDTLQSTAVGSSSQSGITASTNSALRSAATYTGFNSEVWNISDGAYPVIVFGNAWENRSDGFNKYNMLVNSPNTNNQYQFPHTNRVTVSFMYNGSSATSSVTAAAGDKIILPDLSDYEKEGKKYIFFGWCIYEEYKTPVASRVVTLSDAKEQTYYAYFRIATAKPEGSEFTYSGEQFSVSDIYASNDTYTVSGAFEGTNAGEYKLIFTLSHLYCWNDSTVTDYELTWKINPAAVNIPNIYEKNDYVTYSGTSRDLSSEFGSELYTTGGDLNITELSDKKFTVTFDLKDKDNYIWSDGATEAKSFDYYVVSGVCGTEDSNLAYRLDSNGVLTVIGEGAMASYSQGSAPWYGQRESIKELVISDGITTVTSNAFYGCSAITSVSVPDSVASIGSSAFSGCSSLESITLPFVGGSIKTSSDTYQYPFGYIFGTSSYDGGVATEQYYYGDSTSSLTSTTYYIPSSLKSVTITGGNILRGAFQSCSSIESITIPDSVTSIGSVAFSDCSSLESITIPDSVTSIGNYAFNGCSSLESVTFGESSKLESIGSYAFYNCSSLTSITIPDSVTSIGNSAFCACSSLESITLPFVGGSIKTSTVKYKYPFGYIFGESSYNGGVATKQYYYGSLTSSSTYTTYYIPSSLKSVTITGGNILRGAFYNCSSLTSVTIGSGVTSIGDSAFSGCSSLTSITIPDSVTSIGKYAFRGCSSLENITVDSGNTVYHSAGNCLIETESKILLAGCKNSIIPTNNSVTSIGEDAFSGCSSLESITIPDSVTSIGEYAFNGCSSLESITIPDSVTSIGKQAFYNCSSLESVTFEENSKLESIGDYAFSDCINLESVIFGEGSKLESIGDYAFSDCINLESVIFGEGSKLESIGDYAFFSCSSLTGITIPDSVTNIGNTAFCGCSSLESATFGENSKLESIGSLAFQKCSSLENITIPNSVTSIGNSAFSGCSSLESVTFGESSKLESIGSYAFYNCSSLTSTTIPDSVTSIGNTAFCGCSSLESATFGENSKLESIGNEAFRDCSSLTSITIPDSVTSIGESAFYGCSSLESITLPFVGESIKTSSDTYQYPFGYIFGSSYYDGGVATEQSYHGSSTYYLTSTTYYIPSSLKSVTITDSNLLYGAFYNCSSLTSVTIGSGVTSIGNSAFEGCSSLENVTFEENSKFESIDCMAFYNCSSLTNITIPDSVTYIGGSAFSGCSSLESITFGENSKLESIGSSTFYNCSSLTSITIPDSVTSIGERTFYDCSSLESVTFGENSKLESIGSSTFYNCSSLESITIPDSVTSIGDYAFSGCSSLDSITLPFVGGSIKTSTVKYKYPFGYIFGESSYDGGVATEQYYYGSSSSSLTSTTYYIPSSLKSVTITGGNILYGAFYNCSSLTSITIPDSVTSIGSYAFCGCSSLTSITIPDSVTSIGSYAFRDCYKLVEVYNKSSLKITAGSSYNGYVGYYALNVYTPNSGASKVDKRNDGYIFYVDGDTIYLIGYSGNDTELVLPEDYNGKDYAIYKYAFCNRDDITSVTIPDSVTSIGNSAFNGCSGLESITLPFVGGSIKTSSDKYQYPFGYIFGESSYDGGVATTQDYYGSSTSSSTYTTYYIPSSLKSVTITGGNILYGAFYNCSSLTSVTIGSGVTSIEESAFYNCSNLKSIIFTDTSTWYRTTNRTNWSNKTGGTATDITNSSTNATYFKSTYYDHYWYKL